MSTFRFHAVFLITARANYHKTVVSAWDHSQEHDLGGSPGVARRLHSGFQAEMGCFCLFCKKPCGIKRGVWGDPPPF